MLLGSLLPHQLLQAAERLLLLLFMLPPRMPRHVLQLPLLLTTE
jgi:hypothetical protein